MQPGKYGLPGSLENISRSCKYQQSFKLSQRRSSFIQTSVLLHKTRFQLLFGFSLKEHFDNFTSVCAAAEQPGAKLPLAESLQASTQSGRLLSEFSFLRWGLKGQRAKDVSVQQIWLMKQTPFCIFCFNAPDCHWSTFKGIHWPPLAVLFVEWEQPAQTRRVYLKLIIVFAVVIYIWLWFQL